MKFNETTYNHINLQGKNAFNYALCPLSLADMLNFNISKAVN